LILNTSKKVDLTSDEVGDFTKSLK